jgi:Tol biopolymer transport system component
MKRVFASVSVFAALLMIASALAAPSQAGPRTGRLVYTAFTGNAGLDTSRPDGTGQEHIVDDRQVYRPKWLPDGSAVSFIADVSLKRSFRSRLDAVDPDGSNRRVLLPRNALPGHWDGIGTYAWSPNGSQVVLCLLSEHFRPRTYVANADGSSMQLVRRKACGEDWSSQDRLLATQGQHLVEMDPDGSNVATISVGLRVNDPEWSPQGGKIVFQCGPPSRADICVVRANGNGLRRLTNSRRTDWSPSWSPNGKMIVWAPTRLSGRQRGDVWRMRADGTGKIRLTNTRRIDEYEPDWTS